MIRWLKRILLAAALLFVAVYVGDWTIYKLRGSPTSKVTVTRTLVVPLKGNKSEYDYLGTADEPCSVSLFPQGSNSACWRLRRNSNQMMNP